MPLLRFCIVAVATMTAIPVLATDWPPENLAGAWSVVSTSADTEASRGRAVLLLIGDHLVLAESFPNRELLPYADTLRISDGESNEQGYTALLHIPAEAPSCFEPGHPETQKPVTFSIEASGDDNLLTVVTTDLTLRAKRLEVDTAKSQIRSLLREADLEADVHSRKVLVLEAFAAPHAASTSDEP